MSNSEKWVVTIEHKNGLSEYKNAASDANLKKALEMSLAYLERDKDIRFQLKEPAALVHG